MALLAVYDKKGRLATSHFGLRNYPMTIAESIRYDLIAMIEDDPHTFQHGGKEYTGAMYGTNRRRPLEIGGFEDQPEITIAVNLKTIEGDAVFGQNNIKVGDQVTVNGKTYRIDRTEEDSFGECLQIDLRSKQK